MINSICDFLRQTSRLHPSKISVVTDFNRVSYSQVNQYSDKLAAHLLSIGVQRGDRVVVCLGNILETIISFWGVQKAGAVISLVEGEMKEHKLAYIIRDSAARVLVTSSERFKQDSIAESLAELVEHVLVVGEKNAVPKPFFHWATSLENAYPLRLDSKVNSIDIDLAAIIYTSGSTGEPKGVMMTHRNMIAATDSLNEYLAYGRNDAISCVLPLSFDYGLYQMIMTFSVGATLILEKDLVWPTQMLKNIEKEKVTILPVVPTLIDLLERHSRIARCSLTSVQKVTNTGAALTHSHISIIESLFPSAEIYSMYGLTECKRCTYLPPQDIHRKPDSVGIAIPNTELWLVDDEGNRLGPNKVGKLVIRGATVMKGYWNKPEKTAEKLRPGIIPGEKVLHTGDYCQLDDEGYLYFKGRADDVVKIRGIKVSPVEIENCLLSIESVREAAVLSVCHEQTDRLYSFVSLEESSSLSISSLKEKCADNLESYKRPEIFFELQNLPKTPNGKIDKLALKAKLNALLSSEENKLPSVQHTTCGHLSMTVSSYQEVQLKCTMGTIAAKLCGPEDGIPVLAIHGWLDNANSFDQIALRLPSARILSIDLPGHGHSYHRASGVYHIWQYVSDVVEVIDLMGWREPALIGHSLGSGVAILTASTFPDRVSQLALIDGMGPPFTTAPDAAVKHLRKSIRLRSLSSNLRLSSSESSIHPDFATYEDAIDSRMKGIGGSLSRSAAELLVKRQITSEKGGYRWRSDPMLTVPPLFQMSEAHVHAFIRAIACPTSMILGDRGLFPQNRKYARLSYFQNLDKHILRGGHHLHLEDAAPEVARILNSFLKASPQVQNEDQILC